MTVEAMSGLLQFDRDVPVTSVQAAISKTLLDNGCRDLNMYVKDLELEETWKTSPKLPCAVVQRVVQVALQHRDFPSAAGKRFGRRT